MVRRQKARVRVPALGLRPRELIGGAVAAAVMGAATSLASRYLARLLSSGGTTNGGATNGGTRDRPVRTT